MRLNGEVGGAEAVAKEIAQSGGIALALAVDGGNLAGGPWSSPPNPSPATPTTRIRE